MSHNFHVIFLINASFVNMFEKEMLLRTELTTFHETQIKYIFFHIIFKLLGPPVSSTIYGYSRLMAEKGTKIKIPTVLA